MNSRRQIGTHIRLLALFVLLSAIPLAAFGWLGWRMLKQDREIETDRRKERLDDAVGLLTREFDRALTAWEDLLRSALQKENSADLPAGAVLVVFDSRGIVSRPRCSITLLSRRPGPRGSAGESLRRSAKPGIPGGES